MNDPTRPNDAEFDPLREGICVRSPEAADGGPIDDPADDTDGVEGIEVDR